MVTPPNIQQSQAIKGAQTNKPNPGTRPALSLKEFEAIKLETIDLIAKHKPQHFQYSVSPLKLKETSLELKDQKPVLVKPQELKLHAEIPDIDDYQSNIEIVGNLFLTIATLSPKLSKLAGLAKKEQALVGAPA